MEDEGQVDHESGVGPSLTRFTLRLFAAIVIVIIITVLAGETLLKEDDPHFVEYNIIYNRVTTSDEERAALDAVEDMDLVRITGIPRYEAIGHDKVTDADEAPNGVRPYLIDRISMDHFTGVVEPRMKSGEDRGAIMNYSFECTWVDNLLIKDYPEWGMIGIPSVQHLMVNVNETDNRSSYTNLSGLKSDGGNYSIENAFIIHQNLSYIEYGPIGGMERTNRQIIILDENLVVRMFKILPTETSLFSW